MNLWEQYQGRCLQGHGVKWIHQSSLCICCKFNIIRIILQFLVCLIQFNPHSLTHWLPLLPPQIKVVSYDCSVEQLLCSHVTHTVFSRNKRALTQVEWCGPTTSPLTVSACHSDRVGSIFFLQHQQCPSESLSEVWGISHSLFCLLASTV